MLTIEKRPSTFQKGAALVAAFLVGLFGSISVLYMVDPRIDTATVSNIEKQASSVDERQDEPTIPAEPRTSNNPPTDNEAPVLTEPDTTKHTEPSQPATPSETTAQPDSATDTESETTDEDTPPDNSGLFGLPILKLLSFLQP